LPAGQNAPQRHPRGLYTEQISETAFTAPRAQNRRFWLYRIRLSAAHPAYRRIANGLVRGTPFDEVEPPPNWLRWDPLPYRRIFFDADGELLIVPQQGRLSLAPELGRIEAGPGEIAVVPRGVKFRLALPDERARGYVCENYGELFQLPELGAIGANGLANPCDFLTPVAL